jgi:hypothetical protein
MLMADTAKHTFPIMAQTPCLSRAACLMLTIGEVTPSRLLLIRNGDIDAN